MSLSLLSRFNRVMFRFGRKLTVKEFDVRALMPDRDEQAVIERKVAAALDLLRSHAPVRYTCLHRDLPRIWVAATQYQAQCLYHVGICLLQFDYVTAEATTAARLAVTLVHEGTHARLLRAGIAYREAQRGRIERLCTLAEIILARRLSANEPLLAEANRELARPEDSWSDEALRRGNLNRLAELGPVAKVAGHLAYRLGRLWRSVRAA